MRGRAAVLAAWLVLTLAGLALDRMHQAQFPLSAGPERDRGDVLLDVFGEFRTVLARFLWFKMDLFHEVLEGEGAQVGEEAAVLPLLRMISLLDPSMTDAYDNMAWDLSQGHGKHKEALALVDEGLRRNPKSFQLHLRRALIAYKDELYKDAVVSGKAAAANAVDEFDILNANRILYWSAKKVDDREAMQQALDFLVSMRPNDGLWSSEQAALKARKP